MPKTLRHTTGCLLVRWWCSLGRARPTAGNPHAAHHRHGPGSLVKRARAIKQTGKQPALIDVRSGQVDHDARRQPDSRTGDGQASLSVGYGLRFVACHCAICAGISEQNERWAQHVGADD